MNADMLSDAQKATVDWLLSRGFIRDRGIWGIAWSNRSGMDFTDLEFYPLQRRANDAGFFAIVGHHASGENPRMQIGTCESLDDVQATYDLMRRINGYPTAEPEDLK